MRLTCPIDGCDRTRPAEHAMCRVHWRQVPQDLQRVVYRTWRERQRGYDGAVERHLQALEDACAAVEGREPVDLFGDDEIDESDTEAARERAWREETGSNDPQGPPIGWRSRRRAEP